jgi:Zn-dependent oligopeptidase
MKRLKTSLFAVAVFMSTLASQQAPAQEKHTPAQKDQAKAMEHMPMDHQTMKDCMQHHEAAMKSIEQMNTTMETAKQANDSARMRAAIDQTQKQLAELKERMSMCSNMMSMMEKMQGMGGMGGMMKRDSK